MKTTRSPHAPSTPLAELAEFFAPFPARFRRSEGPQALERYLTGLSTEHPNKDCEPLARVVPGTSEQRLQGLRTAMTWDEEDLNRQRVERMLTLPTEGDGALIVDDTGFATQGKCSVGVARQYSGPLGKTANCQVAVNGHFAERTIAWPVATRLYLHESWAKDPAWCRKAQVPEAVRFRTKPAIALAPLDRARARGVPHACVVAGADSGDPPNFLAGPDERRGRHVVAVRRDFAVVGRRRQAEPARRAEALLEELPASAWRTIRWREGSRGRLRDRFAAVRCWRVTSDGRRHLGGLIGEREASGQERRREYHWSNFGPAMPLTTMVEYAHRRHGVERSHKEAQGPLGWDQYQGRLWTGFHRPAVAVMLASSSLVRREWQQRPARRRRGRPRRAFSPPAGPAAPAAIGGPSLGGRLAPRRGAA